jgi:hypothetical protein
MRRLLGFNGDIELQERTRAMGKDVVFVWCALKKERTSLEERVPSILGFQGGKGVMLQCLLPCKVMVGGRLAKFICSIVMRLI